jgi:hypothetical protein
MNLVEINTFLKTNQHNLSYPICDYSFLPNKVVIKYKDMDMSIASVTCSMQRKIVNQLLNKYLGINKKYK